MVNLDKSLVHLLSQLDCNWGYYDYDRVSDNVLRNCKWARDNLKGESKRDEIINKGLNVYKKRGVSIDSLIEYAIRKEFIDYRDERNELRLTEHGYDCLMKLLTNDYSLSYLEYKQKIEDALKARRTIKLRDRHIAQFFHDDVSIKDLLEIYKENEFGKTVAAYHKYQLEIMMMFAVL